MTIFNADKIGQNVKRWRELNKISQRSLAAQLYTTPATLCHIESGDATMSMPMFNRLLIISQQDPNYFFCDRETSSEELIHAHIDTETYNTWLAQTENIKEKLKK